jgi:hypothetical protein
MGEYMLFGSDAFLFAVLPFAGFPISIRTAECIRFQHRNKTAAPP